MGCTRKDRHDANGGVHTDTANEDREYRQSTYEDRQVANDEVEDLENLYDQKVGE
jgi:hypothetical protein